MRILHICSYYIGNKLYMNLVKHLASSGLDQEVYIPIKNKKYIGANQLSSEHSKVNYYYKNIIKAYDKLFYFRKINKQFRDIEKTILCNKEIDVVHAHTLYSDGGTAYKLYKKYNIDYIVNIRNTDINVFYKYGIHLRPFIYNVLLDSKAVIFISHAYKQKLLSILPSNIMEQIQNKCYVIPNGINDYWHETSIAKTRKINLKDINLLFVGQIDKNKNLETVISVCAKLCNEGYNSKLSIIGTGPLEIHNKRLCSKLSIQDRVIFHGYINELDKLTNIMDKCDIFILPSFKETFGLVYVESMTRGLPIIYTKGQGIDGYFNEGEVGFSINPVNVDMIKEAIEKIILNYNSMSKNCIENSKIFDWKNIHKHYVDIYN